MMSDKKETIYHALSEFQSKVGKIIKNEEGDAGKYKYKYASLPLILDSIATPLRECGLAFTQIPSGLGKLITRIVHLPTGEFIEGENEMTASLPDAQKYGSLISYMRRYALTAMLGLNVDEDDDGNAASGAKPERIDVNNINAEGLPF